MIRLGAMLVLSLLVGFGLVPGGGGPAGDVSAEEEPAADAGSGFLGYYLEMAGGGVAAERDPGVAALKRAVALREKDAAGARSAFLTAAELLPGLADWAHVLAADAAARSGDTADVRRLLANTEPVLAREWGWRSLVRAYRAAGDPARAAAHAAAAAARIEDATRAAEAWRTAGDLRLLRRDSAGARVAYRNAIELAPGSEHALGAARALTNLRVATPDDHLMIGRLYLRHGNHDRAISGIDAYFKSGRASAAEMAELRFEIAKASFRGGRYADAERRLTAVLEAAPGAAYAAEALLLLGRSQFRLNRRGEAVATLLRAAERHPTAAASAEALFIVADLEHDDGRLDRARELYRRAIEIAPGSAAAADAAMRLGALAYVGGEAEAAVSVFEAARSAQEERRRRQQASFWAARAYLKSGADSLGRTRLQETLALDPASYYGMRAADLLGDGSWRTMLAPEPAHTTRSGLESSGALVRLDVLREVGLSEAARYEMDRLRRYLHGRDDALYALAEAFLERDQIFLSISIGREIQRRDQAWNERLLRIIYPFPHRERIMAEAARHGVDPFLVAGLVRQESMFNAVAVSPAGAVGLMQVMPATARSLARQAGISNFNTEQLKNPDTNIRIGMLFMAQLLRQYNGRLPDLLAAYNAGSGRLARWRSFPEYGDDDLFAERIPFAETRDYVKIVQQNRRIYEAVYGPRGAGTVYGEEE